MNRRALERGRRSRRKAGVGLFRLFDGARARERYPLLEKDPLRGQKSSICEECRKANSLLKKNDLGKCRQKRERTVSFGSEDSHIGYFCPLCPVFREEGRWKDGVPDVGESTRFSRARDDFGDTPDVPRDDEPSARGFVDASDASQTRMPRTLFFKKKVSGKRAGRGVTLPLHGVLRQVVGLILLKIPIEQSHGVSHAWLLANMLGVKKSYVAHRFRGR